MQTPWKVVHMLFVFSWKRSLVDFSLIFVFIILEILINYPTPRYFKTIQLSSYTESYSINWHYFFVLRLCLFTFKIK